MSGDNNPIKVVLDADRMTVSVSMPPGLDPLISSAASVHAALDERGVAPTQDRAKAVEALVAAYSPTSGCEGVVARGVPPVQGDHGRVELAAKFASGETPAGVCPDPPQGQAASHYERTSFVTVSVGEVLGHIYPPVEGTDGVDVTGRILACKGVRSAELTIDHTIERRSTGELVAQAAGILHRSGNLLRVSDTLIIDQYVDFSTGNLNFPGNIEVARGVRDCFEVRCDGSLTVAGLVEAATLSAKVDVRLNSGMAGREKGTLAVGRNLTAKYLDGVEASVARDATVTTELTNARLRVGRNLTARGATIIGGCVDARGTVEVGHLGSEAGVITEIILGHDVTLEANLVKGLAYQATLAERAASLKAKIDTLRKAGGRKNAPAAEEVTGLEFELDIATTKANALKTGLSRAMDLLDTSTRGKLVVFGQVYRGVKIWLGQYLIEPRDQAQGQLEFLIDPEGRLRITRNGEDHATSFRVSRDSRFPDRSAIKRDVAA